MTGGLSNFGSTVVWFSAIAVVVCVMAALAEWFDEWHRRRRHARVIREAERYYRGKPW